jgi:hypothetical protein
MFKLKREKIKEKTRRCPPARSAPAACAWRRVSMRWSIHGRSDSMDLGCKRRAASNAASALPQANARA